MTVSEGKKGQMTFLYDLLPQALRLAEEALKAGGIVLVRDHDGKDMSVGVATVLLWHLYGDDGLLRSSPAPRGESLSGPSSLRRHVMKMTHWTLTVTKDGVRSRLHWVVQRRPGANPSRTTLKWINSFLMSPLRPR
jgi:tRNA A64-2'-O-ribosylphosphate transferase